MKIIQIKVFKLTYTIDLPVLLLFITVSLDVISTMLFVSLTTGVEKNPILSKLIDASIWFIPIYLFMTDALFIPFLSKILRRTFCYSLSLVSIVLAVNNFSLIIFDSAFLIDFFGFNTIVAAAVLFGFAVFAFFLKRERLNNREVILMGLKLVAFILFLGSIHLMFLLLPLFAL